MIFVDKTYFVGDLFISNLNETKDNAYLYSYLAEYEENCLRVTLGDCLYNELMTQIEWNTTTQEYQLIAGADQKWDWLINGHSYTNDDISNTSGFDYNYCGCGCHNLNCNTYHWQGFTQTIDRRIPTTTINGQSATGVRVKKSYLAYYIYWYWSLNNDSITTGTGEKTTDVKNTMSISNTHKRIKAHNSFVSWVADCNSNGRVGLYKFVQDFSDLFPEWQGACLNYESII